VQNQFLFLILDFFFKPLNQGSVGLITEFAIELKRIYLF